MRIHKINSHAILYQQHSKFLHYSGVYYVNVQGLTTIPRSESSVSINKIINQILDYAKGMLSSAYESDRIFAYQVVDCLAKICDVKELLLFLQEYREIEQKKQEVSSKINGWQYEDIETHSVSDIHIPTS